MKILSTIGVIGSGKNFTADLLTKDCDKVKQINFSDGIRELTWKILGWQPKDSYEYEKFKNFPIFMTNNEGTILSKLRGRELLQRVGTDAIRNNDKNFWANYWKREAVQTILKKEIEIIVCTDCRHENEVQIIIEVAKKMGIEYQFIFCDFKSERYELNDHPSEKFAREIVNTGKFKDKEDITDFLEWRVFHESGMSPFLASVLK